MAKDDTPQEIKWLDAPEDHDYPAAASYLAIIYHPSQVTDLVNKLKAAEMSEFKAKDIFRASGLSLLGVSNSHVDKDREKITSGKTISPLLLVRDTANGKVVIADGYHRLCSVYSINEDETIPCKIV
jgi:disulfide oxidoreductase YuzD